MKQRLTDRSLLLLMVLSFGHFTVDMFSGSLPTLFPEIRAAYGISYTQVGLLMLISQITSSVIQPLFGLVSDRIATRWLLPTSLVVTTIGLLLIGSATTYPMVLVGVVVMGLGIASYHPEASKLAHFVGGERKGRALSIFAIGGNIGIGFGPAVMGLGLAVWGMRGTLFFVPVTVVAVALILRHLKQLYAHEEQAAEASEGTGDGGTSKVAAAGGAGDGADGAGGAVTERRKQRTQWSTVALLLFVIFLRSGAHSSIMTFIPMYYTDHLGHSGAYSSMLLTTFLLAGALGTFLGGPASDRVGPRKIILGSFIIATPFVGLLSLTSGGILPFVLMGLIGCSLIASFAVTTVLGQSLLANNVGLASGLTLGFSVGTGGITATGLGWVADQWSLSVALVAIAVLTLAGAVMSYWLPRGNAERAAASTGVAG